MFKSRISRIGSQLPAHDMEELNFYESEFDDFKKKSKRRKLWQATDGTADLPFFLLEVFSEIWIAWNLILFAVIAYDQFMIPFSVAFNFELTGKFFAVDILCFFLLAETFSCDKKQQSLTQSDSASTNTKSLITTSTPGSSSICLPLFHSATLS